MVDQDQITPPILSHRYRLENELGSGGMGIVYRAYDRLNGQTVAVKLINVPPEYFEFMSQATSSNLLVPLAREFQTLASLRHPNIISVLDYGFAGADQPFLVMELLEHARELSVAGSDQPVEAQMGLIGQVLQALKYLHRHRIVHCDLKPGNVLVSGQGVARVLDFGLALRQGQAAEGSGTLGYMSPEVLAGGRATPHSDLYAVGVMAYELLTGRLPHYHGNVQKMAEAILGAPADLSMVPVEWQAFIGQLLEKEPGGRYASAGEALAALQAGLGQPETESQTIRESYLQAAPFVGREQEVETLTAALTNAKAGNGSSWLVGGESGVGKSRLLDEVRTKAQVEGFLVLRGQAVEGGGLPYQLWREPLRRLALTVEMSDLEAGILKPIMPDISALLERDVPDAPELTGEAGQQRLALTVAALFQRQPQPLTLLLEDLQWSTESLEPLRQMNRFVGRLPLLVVANYRSDERPNLPDELPSMTVLVLERLHEDEVAQLSAAMLGAGGSEPYLVERLQQETEGNTFFMVEIVRALAEAAGRLGDISQMTLPRSILAGGIQKLVRRRLEQIPAHLRDLLKLSAVAGRELDLNVLGILDQSNFLQEWLQAGSEAAVLDIQDQRWRFAHDKLRQAVLVDLTADETRQFNQRAAEGIEAAYPDNPAFAQVLFDHYYNAEHVEKSAHYARFAAEQLIGRSSYRDALALLEKAFAMLPPEGMAAARMRLFKLMGEALNSLGELPRAREYFNQSLALAQREQDTRGVVGALIGICDIKHIQGDIDGARENLEEAFQLAQGLNDDAITAKTLMALGGFYRESDYTRSRDYFLEAMKLYEKLGDTEGQAGCHFNLGVILGYFGELQAVSKHLDAALALFKASGNRRGIFSCLNTTGNAIGGDDRVKAEQLYREALQIARETGERRNIAISCNNLANLLMDAGRYQETVALQMESVSIAKELNAQVNLGGTLINVGLTYHEIGDFEAARSTVEQGLEIARTVDAPRYVAFGLLTLSSILRKQSHLETARLQAVEALELAQAIGEPWFVALAHLELGTVAVEFGDYGGGGQHLDEAIRLCTQHGLPVEKAMALVPRGLLALLQGDLEQARVHFTESTTVAASQNNIINIAIGQAHLAFVEMREGHHEEARGLVQEGLARAAQIASKRVLAHLLAVQAWLHEPDQPERSALLCGLVDAHPSAEYFMKQWCLLPLVSRLRDQFGEQTFTALLERGRALALDEAVRQEMTHFT